MHLAEPQRILWQCGSFVNVDVWATGNFLSWRFPQLLKTIYSLPLDVVVVFDSSSTVSCGISSWSTICVNNNKEEQVMKKTN